MTWQQQMIELKHMHLEATAPAFYAASGGRTMKVKPYTDKTSNGLTNAICDYLKFKGHYANRINTTGTMRNINGVMKYTHSGTRRGTADITAIVNGRHVSIEVKCYATKDRVRPEQIKEQSRVEAAGGIYIIAADMESFLTWYKLNCTTISTANNINH